MQKDVAKILHSEQEKILNTPWNRILCFYLHPRQLYGSAGRDIFWARHFGISFKSPGGNRPVRLRAEVYHWLRIFVWMLTIQLS